jgi:hypothetical protein
LSILIGVTPRRVQTGLLMLLLSLGVVSGQKTIPRFEGDGEGAHDNQPKWCQRIDTEYKANCGECNPPICDNGKPRHNNNPKCGVNCRPLACACHPGCNQTGHNRGLTKRQQAELKLHANLAFATREWATTLFMRQWEPPH